MTFQNPSMLRTALRTTAIAMLAAASLFGCGGGGAADSKTPDAAASSGEGPVGKPAAEVAAEFIMGDGSKSLAEAKGKVVIVDFWATYCEPCKKSFPKYQELVEEFGGELAVIAVSMDNKDDVEVAALKAFAEEHKGKFAILWDKDHKLGKDYPIPTMPTSYVIDKSGVIRHQHIGFKDGEQEEIRAEVKALIEAK
jgi:cytochrome c biogenesis protein CcmG/thiol:disulfide interchange protein DsbE